MKNYIVRNCPALNHLSELSLIANDNSLKKCYICYMQPNFCKDITDCVMKRIVERCSLYEFNYPVNQAIIMLTQNIKDMLEIEECENE